MLDLLDAMRMWAEDTDGAMENAVAIRFVVGRTDVSNRASYVELSSDERLGMVAVWQFGNLEAEVYEVSTANRLFVRSEIVSSVAALTRILDEARGVVARGVGTGELE